jgi:hypothetical protein
VIRSPKVVIGLRFAKAPEAVVLPVPPPATLRTPQTGSDPDPPLINAKAFEALGGKTVITLLDPERTTP